MAKVYVVCFDWGYEGYEKPVVAFSNFNQAGVWVDNWMKDNFTNPKIDPTPVIVELEIDQTGN